MEALMLGAWMGAAILMAAVVAPAAFELSPSRAAAGALVGRVLPAVFGSGLAVAIILGVSHLARRARAPFRFAAISLLAVSCAAAQFVVAPRIAAVRAGISGPIEALAVDDPQRRAFGRLHAISVGWLGLALVAAFCSAISLVRSQHTHTRRPT